MFKSFLCLAVAAWMLAGCASYGGSSLVPGQSSAQDVRALMGEPVAIHKANPGLPYTESWEYPRGPFGSHTYMVRINASGQVGQIDQVLTRQTIAAVKIGADTRDEVRKLLGRPGRVQPERVGGEYWDYYAMNLEGRPRPVILSVSFDSNGIASSTGERDDTTSVGRWRR